MGRPKKIKSEELVLEQDENEPRSSTSVPPTPKRKKSTDASEGQSKALLKPGKIWQPEEDATIIELVKEHGKQWGKVTEAFNKIYGVTESQVRNHWHNSLKKKIASSSELDSGET
ncbi:uncharacterized protein SPPG_08479 [Spizellomyces punctatus DAOM BR117]|uniref:Uncharacterized protein n=1 Tax=Spizellomyces punctatus (strain DAOM BR117) TaxID=645134 RepID=A0A0L0H5W7_SPIPD|nr:uncharacterized protein SPPG_08479 [Spizellomyces punctatus DAOM BR117]KNC96093.1 hypothetical protein SPPG_08479 [Spizellomyces punctatus DAOM BR117]|eukprot:XP_016604133.1 hypothetical protein SPPG_08479 [Spizellomyces punctatus DAOM BR117]